MRFFTPPPQAKVASCCFMLVTFLAVSASAMNISGPTVGCPGSTRQYTVYGTSTVTKVTVILGTIPNANPQVLTYRYVNDGVPFDVAFPANYQGIVTLSVTSWFGFEGGPFSLGALMAVTIRVPSPAVPNGGLVTACQAGEQISLSSLPVLTNGPNDCYFHCGVQWAGPQGWTLQNDLASGNPLSDFSTFDNAKLNVPSGVSNGTVGQVTVTAFYSQCIQAQNTSSSATIFYGAPIVSGAYVNGSSSQSFNRVTNGQASLSISSEVGAANAWTWQIDGGSGYIYPNGNSCNVSTSNFVRVTARLANRCGQGGSYTFYIQNSSTYGFRIAPNPASSNLSVQFDYPEQTEAVSSVTLYNEKGKLVKEFDGKKAKKEKYFDHNKAVEWDIKTLERGRYFLHVDYESYTEKLQVSIN